MLMPPMSQRLVSPLTLTGSCSYLAKLAVNLIGLLGCHREKVCPITFSYAFCGLGEKRIHEIDPVDLGNVPFGVPG